MLPEEPTPSVPLTGFYLDTSAVRAIPDREKRLARIGAFTSVFTLLELLDDATGSEEEYRRRRAAVRRVMESGMHIVPDMPQVSLMRAFPALWACYGLRSDDHLVILRLADVVTKTPLHTDFDRLQAADHRWRAVRKSWAALAARVVSDSKTDQPTMWEVMENAKPEELAKYGIDPSLTTEERFSCFISSEINIAASRYVLVLKALESLNRPSDADLGAKIDASWNGQGQPYMRVLAVDHLSRVYKRETAAKNDAYDRDHFAYIEPGVTLVTDDKYMSDLAQYVGLRVGNSSTLKRAMTDKFDIA